jgi:type IV pilus assembly protein PilB
LVPILNLMDEVEVITMAIEVKRKKLGEILVDEGIITQEQLDKAIRIQEQTGLKLGDVLVSDAIITQEQLINALDMQSKILTALNASIDQKRKKLGEILIEKGIIDELQFERVLELQKESGRKLGELLVVEGLVTEEQIIEVLEEQLGIKSIDIVNHYIDTEVAHMIPEKICREYMALAVEVINGQLIVAMTDPLDYYAVHEIKNAVPLPVKIAIASSKQILTKIDDLFSNVAAERAVEDFVKMYNTGKNIPVEEAQGEKEVLNAPIVRFINSKIEDAVRNGVSDLHIEPGVTGVRVRFRIDGSLQENMTISGDIMNALTSRVKIMANLNIAEKRLPQDGRIQYRIGNKFIDLRVSTLPTMYGEKIVMRILDKSSFVLSKERLGLSLKELHAFERMISKSFGVILVTGPTGSGKTSTLYCALAELNDVRKNIITLEDPVEYELDGINQVQLNPKANLTFATGLRSILRQDPDIVMVGEIRDSETAEIAIRAAMTGHLVLSTIHTNDAPGTVTRVIDMGIEPFLVSASIVGIIAQRLVKRICSACRKSYEPDDREKRIMGISMEEDTLIYKGQGCKVCNYSGYKGRVAIFEMMEMERNLRNLIDKRATVDEIRDEAIRLGMLTLRDSCKNKVLKGETTVEELIRVTFNY